MCEAAGKSYWAIPRHRRIKVVRLCAHDGHISDSRDISDKNIREAVGVVRNQIRRR